MSVLTAPMRAVRPQQQMAVQSQRLSVSNILPAFSGLRLSRGMPVPAQGERNARGARGHCHLARVGGGRDMASGLWPLAACTGRGEGASIASWRGWRGSHARPWPPLTARHPSSNTPAESAAAAVLEGPSNGATTFAMRHGNKKVKLNLPADQRKALMRSLTTEVLRHGKIKTTKPRAKAIRKYVDKMITLAKTGTLHARRQVRAGGRASGGRPARPGAAGLHRPPEAVPLGSGRVVRACLLRGGRRRRRPGLAWQQAR